MVFDSDPKDPVKLKKSLRLPASPKPVEKREGQEVVSFFLPSSGLAAAVAEEEEAGCLTERMPQTLVVGGGGDRGVGGGGLCGGGRGSDDGLGSGSWHGRDITDKYYEMMIEANPGNPLFLANYAKFLKEVIFQI